MKKILEQTWFVFTLATVLALSVPGFVKYVEPYLKIQLILLMTISLRKLKIKEMFNKSNTKNGLKLFLMSYVWLSALILILSLLLIKNFDYRAGFIVMAAAPCAISCVPFSKLLKGDVQSSTTGVVINYLSALIITPTIIWIFFRQLIDMTELITTIVQVIIIPIILSRFLAKLNNKLDKYDTSIINILFLIGVYGFVGLNRDTIVNNFFSLKLVLIVLFIRTFLISTVMFFLTKKHKKFGISLTLFSSYKNLGYTAILALTLFGRAAALPAALGIIFELMTFVWLERLIKITNASHT